MGPASDVQLLAWGIESLWLGLIPAMVGIGGIAFSVFALRRILRGHRRGRGWAVAGILVGIWWLWAGADSLIEQAGQADRDASGKVVDEGSVVGADLRNGDCLSSLPGIDFRTVRLGPCDQPHAAEVFDSFTLNGTDFPGDDQVEALANGGCLGRLAEFVGPGRQGAFEVANTIPTAGRWRKGKRDVLCMLVTRDGTLLPGGTAKAT